MKVMKVMKTMKTMKTTPRNDKKAMKDMKECADQRLVGRRMVVVDKKRGLGWVGSIIGVSGNRYEIHLDDPWYSGRGGHFVRRHDFYLL